MSKNTFFIGDVHGRSDWEKMLLIALPKFWHIVFLGDYVDSFDIPPYKILDNLRKIIGYKKKKYGERITLLLGNHDYAYIDKHISTSGYNHQFAIEYRNLLIENFDLFDVAWGYENDNKQYTLATHAGLTLTYYNNYVKPLIEDPNSKINKITNGKGNELKLHQVLNYMKHEDILWKVGAERGGMGCPGPLWADYNELISDVYPNINQVVGHTAIGPVRIGKSKSSTIYKVDGELSKGTSNLLIEL